MPEEVKEQAAAEAEVAAKAEVAAVETATPTPTVITDLETQALLTQVSTLMGSEVTEDRLGAAFAWAKANTTDDHLQNLVAIADAGTTQSQGAIILLLNRHTAAAIAQPVGSRLSDRVIKRTMSHTAQVPVFVPETATPNFVQNESNAIVAEAKSTGHIPTASEIIARLKLEQGTN